MTKDFLLGLCVGLLVMLFLIWLFDRPQRPTPPDEAAAKPTPKYSSNVTELEQEGKLA